MPPTRKKPFSGKAKKQQVRRPSLALRRSLLVPNASVCASMCGRCSSRRSASATARGRCERTRATPRTRTRLLLPHHPQSLVLTLSRYEDPVVVWCRRWWFSHAGA
jgi:hypothetical protein